MTTSDEIKTEVLPEDYTSYDLSFKMIVIGDAGVGKSCLTTKASKGIFDEAYSATVGFEFLVFNVKINEKVVKLQIWDTCGQEIYRSLISSFYRNASLAMMVYAIDSKESFNHIEAWLKEIKLQSNPDIKIFLIGNKIDLEDQRVIQTSQAKNFAEKYELDYFMETSAKTGINVQDIFIQAAKILYKDYLTYYEEKKKKAKKEDSTKLIKKTNLDEKDQKKGCC